MEYTLKIDENGIKINGVLIDEEIFQKEEFGYYPEEREELIERIIGLFSETTKENDKFLMKEDLKYLMNLKDVFIFSSIYTNEYIAKSDNNTEFNKICKELIELTLKSRGVGKSEK